MVGGLIVAGWAARGMLDERTGDTGDPVAHCHGDVVAGSGKEAEHCMVVGERVGHKVGNPKSAGG